MSNTHDANCIPGAETGALPRPSSCTNPSTLCGCNRNRPCSLESVKLPWQKTDATDAAAGGSTKVDLAEHKSEVTSTTSTASTDGAKNAPEKKLPKGYTPPKGRPTPKRHDQEVKRGVIRDPNAMSTPQAAQKRKELKKSMSKEEWKDYKKQERAQRRAQNKELQAKMDAGEEAYLMDRDKGKVRKYVRDWVDSRRFISNYIMPAAFVMLLIMLIGQFVPQMAAVLSTLSMIFIATVLAEAFIIGRKANKAVKEKFPEENDTGFGLGMYAFSRASQPRNWRTPKPQVALGSKV